MLSNALGKDFVVAPEKKIRTGIKKKNKNGGKKKSRT
jgi:hypothetical protein